MSLPADDAAHTITAQVLATRAAETCNRRWGWLGFVPRQACVAGGAGTRCVAAHFVAARAVAARNRIERGLLDIVFRARECNADAIDRDAVGTQNLCICYVQGAGEANANRDKNKVRRFRVIYTRNRPERMRHLPVREAREILKDGKTCLGVGG